MFLSDGTIDRSLFTLFLERDLNPEEAKKKRADFSDFFVNVFKRLPKSPVRAADLPYVVLENGDLYSLEQMQNAAPQVVLTDVVDVSAGWAVRKDGTLWRVKGPKLYQDTGVSNIKAAYFGDSANYKPWLLGRDGKVYRHILIGGRRSFTILEKISHAVAIQPEVNFDASSAALILLEDGTLFHCRADIEDDQCEAVHGVRSIPMTH